jgi:hypothetical protein
MSLVICLFSFKQKEHREEMKNQSHLTVHRHHPTPSVILAGVDDAIPHPGSLCYQISKIYQSKYIRFRIP